MAEINSLHRHKAIWDRDLYSVPTEEIKDMKCLMTLFNGKIVYRAAEFK